VTWGRMESCGKRLEFGWTDKEEEWEQMQNDNDDDELGRRKKDYPCPDPFFHFLVLRLAILVFGSLRTINIVGV